MFRKILIGFAVLLLLLVATAAIYLQRVNDYQADGRIDLDILDRPVTVIRDESGVPYIYAQSMDDALRAQGFIAAQDRLSQIEFTKYMSGGRLAELIGPAGLRTDIRHRVVGIPRHGKRHAALLTPEARRSIQYFLDGLNAYIENQVHEHPLGLRLMGIEATPWTIEDAMTMRYFLHWSSTGNLESELITQALVDRLGAERAAEISQLTINPDAEGSSAFRASPDSWSVAGLRITDPGWFQPLSERFAAGSNQWVFSPGRSTTGAPVLANNPHIDARRLPGIWHPVALITPEFRVVGAAGPGTPGFAVARTSHIAFGVTNSNGDGLDLFIEREDPERPGYYLEGERSLPFETIEETLLVRDRSTGGYREQPLVIRLTRRGPVISDHGMSLEDGRVISMRWAVPETMEPDPGSLPLLRARNVSEAGAAIARIAAYYNYVVADMDGNIAHFTAGPVPIRLRGDGSAPLEVMDGSDAWAGMIPADEMPGAINPARGWVGNANHRTLPADYPYAYSTHFAHSWRYRRMLQLLDKPGKFSPDDHWQFMRDVGNTMAEAIVPLMVPALLAHEDTRELGEILSGWDYVDDPDAVAPTIFHATYRSFARRVFTDELGEELAMRMLQHVYYWQDRLYRMIEANESDWFDDVDTEAIETRDELFYLAALDAVGELSATLGSDPQEWRWGRVHTVTFFSPLIPGEAAASILGAGTHPMFGSTETMNRGKFSFNDPYAATYIDSMRFVADLSDPDKVWAVLAGGVSGRQFDPHLKDQVGPWLSGEPHYLWFSDEAIEAHAQSALLLTP